MEYWMGYTALNIGVVLEMGCFQVLFQHSQGWAKKNHKNSTRFQENYDEFYYWPPDPKCSH